MKLKYIRKFFFGLSILLFIMLVLFVSALLLLQRPNVQTYAVKKVLKKIETQYNTEADIESVHLKFPTSLVLKSFYLEDQTGDTLIFANELNVQFSYLQPFKRKIHISKLTLDGADLQLSKSIDEPYNFEFLFQKKETSYAKTKPAKKKPIDFSIYTIDLKNTNISLQNEENFTLSPAELKQLKINVKDFDFEQKTLDLQNILIDELNVSYAIEGAPKDKNPIHLESFLPDLGWKIAANEIEVINSNVQIINPHAKASNLPIDLRDLHLQDINTKIKDVQLDSTLELNIVDLNVLASDQLNISEFYSKINVSSNDIELKRLGINFNNSAIQLNAKLSVKDFQKFPQQFYQNSDIKGFIAASDANLFIPRDKRIQKGIQLDMHSTGNLAHLTLQELKIKSGEVELVANGTIHQILNTDRTNFDLNINRLVGSAENVNKIIPWLELPDQVTSLGNTVASGHVSGKISNVLAELEIQSDVGAITTNIAIDASGKDLVYTGDVSIPALDIQKIFPKAPMGKAAGTLELNGSGTDLAGLSGNIKGNFTYLEFNNYKYENVIVNGNLIEQIFKGDIAIDDENLEMAFDGLLDLSDSIPRMESQLNIKHADLKALKLYEKPFRISLQGNVDITGTDLSNTNGYLNLAALHIENDSSSVDFDTTLFKIKSEPNFKAYDIISDKMVAHVEGDFDPIVLTNEFQRYFAEYVYYLNFEDTAAIQAQNIKGNLSIAEEFGLIKFLLGTVDIPENIEAKFEFNNTANIFNLNAHASHLGYKQIEIDSFFLDTYTEDNELIVDVNFGKLLAANKKINVDLVDLFAISTKSSISAQFNVEEENAPNRFSLSPHLNFYQDSILVHFNNSYFKINDIEWPFTANNEIILKQDEIIANNFAIQNENQSFQIVNAASDLSDALVEFNNISIPALANIVQLDTIIQGGLLTGRIRLEDVLKDINADVDLSFTELQVFNFYCDSLSIDAFYDKAKNKVDVGALFNDPNYDIFANGSYDLTKGVENAADIDLKVNRVSLSFLDLILKNEAQFDLYGQGDLQFKGSVFKPVLLGEAYVIDTAKIHIKFLGTDLIVMPENGVREKVIFTENTIDLQSMNVRDPYGNRAYAEGKLTHFHFKDMSVDARLFTDHFNLLNTTFDDNEDFYGLAFGEGSVTFSGLTRNINMDIDMKTKKGTRVSIPIASVGDTKDYNFKFINPLEDTIEEEIKEELIEIKGVNMNFDLEVTKDAELELVLNTDSENNLKAIGQGNLSLRSDQNKQLSIYGKYNLIDGDYVFSPQNLINKEFKIENGSSIFWNGNPYEAALDVDALYKVDAKVDNILQDSLRSAQTIPMDVVIHIGGTLSETDVSFGIEPRRSTLASSFDEVITFLDEIKNDEGEITTQAISLLLVGRFLPSNSTVFTGTSFSAGEFGKTTALELVSNQVSSYLTDAISKLITEVEFNVNIAQREDYTLEEPGQTTTVQLEYSQKLVNNRLIVNIGGNFAFQDENSEEENTIAGDFEVEGLLTEDGKLRAKAFHRTADYDIFNQDRSKTGVSISYTKDFDKIGEVFKPDANKKKKRQENRQKRKSNRENNKSIKDQDKAAATKEDDDGG